MKKMNLTTKYLKTGGYSVLVSCIAIAIVIIVNLFVNQLPTTVTQFDMSATDTLSISEQTVELVKGIKDEITVYYIAQHGSEDEYVSTMLDKYKALNNKIKIEQVDPALNPGFLSGDKAQLSEGSLFVESAKRSKSISSYDIYFPGVSMESIYSYYQQYGQMPSATGFDLENCMTGAINYVTTDILPVVYSLQGHGEYAISSNYLGYLEAESIEMKDLTLATLEAVPEDCACILINVPEKDISENEANMILAYLKAGGKLMINTWYKSSVETPMPNLASVLEYYGVKAIEGLIIEGDANARIPSDPTIAIPKFGSHEITTPLSGYYLFSADNMGIEIGKELREGLTVTPLLMTSANSYARVDYNTETLEKIDGDIAGPFNLAVAISETLENGSTTQIVWANTPSLVNEGLDVYGTNSAMFVNSFGWLCEKQDAISIPVKNFEQTYLELTESQGNLLSAIFTIVLPLAVIVTGFVVWFRRRSR